MEEEKKRKKQKDLRDQIFFLIAQNGSDSPDLLEKLMEIETTTTLKALLQRAKEDPAPVLNALRKYQIKDALPTRKAIGTLTKNNWQELLETEIALLRDEIEFELKNNPARTFYNSNDLQILEAQKKEGWEILSKPLPCATKSIHVFDADYMTHFEPTGSNNEEHTRFKIKRSEQDILFGGSRMTSYPISGLPSQPESNTGTLFQVQLSGGGKTHSCLTLSKNRWVFYIDMSPEHSAGVQYALGKVYVQAAHVAELVKKGKLTSEEATQEMIYRITSVMVACLICLQVWKFAEKTDSTQPLFYRYFRNGGGNYLSEIAAALDQYNIEDLGDLGSHLGNIFTREGRNAPVFFWDEASAITSERTSPGGYIWSTSENGELSSFLHCLSRAHSLFSRRFRCFQILAGTNFNISTLKDGGASAYKPETTKYLPPQVPFSQKEVIEIFMHYFNITIPTKIAKQWRGRPKILIQHLFSPFVETCKSQKISPANALQILLKMEQECFERAVSWVKQKIEGFLKMKDKTAGENLLICILHDIIFVNKERITSFTPNLERSISLMDFGLAYFEQLNSTSSLSVLEPAVRAALDTSERCEQVLKLLKQKKKGESFGKGERSALIARMETRYRQPVTSWGLFNCLAKIEGLEILQHYTTDLRELRNVKNYSSWIKGNQPGGVFPEKEAGPDFVIKLALLKSKSKSTQGLPPYYLIQFQSKDVIAGTKEGLLIVDPSFVYTTQKPPKKNDRNLIDISKRQIAYREAISKVPVIGILVSFSKDSRDVFQYQKIGERFILVHIQFNTKLYGYLQQFKYEFKEMNFYEREEQPKLLKSLKEELSSEESAPEGKSSSEEEPSKPSVVYKRKANNIKKNEESDTKPLKKFVKKN